MTDPRPLPLARLHGAAPVRQARPSCRQLRPPRPPHARAGRAAGDHARASSSSTTTAPRPGATTRPTARRRPCRARCGCSCTQTLICNDKVNDGAYLGLRPNFPPGTLDEPQQPGRLDGRRLGLPDPVLHRLHHARCRAALQARGLRRGGAGALRLHHQRVPGRRHRPLRQAVGDDELRPVVRGRRREDGRSTGSTTARPCGTPRATWATWRCGSCSSPSCTSASGSSPTPPAPGATAAARATSACACAGRRPFFEIQNIGNGTRVQRTPACGAATRPRRATATTSARRTSSRSSSAASPTRRTSPTPRTRLWPA